MSFWTDALERKADDGRARQLYDAIFENAPGPDAAEYVELTIKVRVKGGNTYTEDKVLIDDAAKLAYVDRYILHAMSRFGTISVLTTISDWATSSTIRTGEILAIEAVTRTVRLNSEDVRRAAGFHPPIPQPRKPLELGGDPDIDLSDFQRPETD